MSIINQVLAQLERRGVQVEQDMVRVVPSRRSVRMVPLLLAALLLSLAAWWWLARGSAGGAKPQQVVASAAPVVSVMQEPVSGIAAPAVIASRSDTLVVAPSKTAVTPVSAVAAEQSAGRMQPEPKPVSQPAPKPAPLPRTVASVPPKPVASVVPSAKPRAAEPVQAPPAVPKVAVAPAKPAVKPLTAAPANKAVQPKQDLRPDKHQSATAAPPAIDAIPMKQVSRSQQAEAEFRKGIELMQQGRGVDAIASYQAALQLDAAHDAARQSLVALLLEDKRRDDAERLLQERLEDRPQHTGFAMLLARLQVERGATGEALVTLERSLAYAEAKADYLAFLAALQQRNNLHADAAIHYHAALQLQPGNGAWLMGYGISLQALRRTEEAKVAYQKALDSKTLSPDLQAFVQRKLKGL